jgi:Na+/H+ antiporter NhaC
MSKLLKLSKWRLILAAAVVVVTATLPMMLSFAEDGSEAAGYEPALYGTLWSLIPPEVAIVLALITKEVFSSLFMGVLIGGIFFATSPNPGVFDESGEVVWQSSNVFMGTVNHIVRDGFLAQLTSGWNMGIIIFLVILGMLVIMMSKTGGAEAFGEWASKRVKSRVGAQLALMVFHLFIFIDDYFACLTVGSVMRPVMNKRNVSRAKLAYLIDATAAPICILAPVSTWAAAVASYVPKESDVNGFTMFVQAIPYNFYAILTIVMILCIILFKFDYGPMARHEYNAEVYNDLFTTPDRPFADAADEKTDARGKVYDLAIPIVALIISCVAALLYTGGYFSPGDTQGNFVDAFANSDAATGLVIGSLIAILITVIYYVARRLIKLKELTEICPKGINAMASPILILCFAWTLKAMTDTLGSEQFVKTAMAGPAQNFESFLPALVFIVSAFIAFSTGTSWGTYGIMIPIVISVFEGVNPDLLVIGIAACLAGGVMGDHCSPISDTTIMASAGAQCNHINHVNTQLPYALTVASVSFVMFIVAGLLRTPIVLPIAIIAIVAVLFLLKNTVAKKQRETFEKEVKTA